MYAVILAGGGGTRLHPLSRPERPKPFLPLLGERSLLQGAVERLSGLTDDVTVVTDRRYERLVRPRSRARTSSMEPLGRNTAAAIALARRWHRAPDDEVMVVAAGRPDRRAAGRFRSSSSRRREAGDRRLRDRRAAGHARGPGRRPATEYGYLIPDLGEAATVEWPAGLSARPFRGEAEAGPGRRARPPGRSRVERGHLPVATADHRGGARAVHRPAPVARPDGRHCPRCWSAPTRRSSGRSRSTTR